MRTAFILISSLHDRFDTRIVIIANFAAGLLVGTLLGLALAPLVRSWMAWKTYEETLRTQAPAPDVPATRVDT
jgi:hypothetical protein